MVEDFRRYCDDENQGHVDQQAADAFLSLPGSDYDAEDAEEVLDWAEDHATTRGERQCPTPRTAPG